MNAGGIVLCGGQSSRMGFPKPLLPFGPELMLPRVLRLLGQVATPIVVVAAPGQALPELPVGTPKLAPTIIMARDHRPGRGPLEGLAAGLHALPDEMDAVYVTACDVPLLEPRFVRRMFELLGDYSIAVPVSGGYQHSLAAVYRRSVLPEVERLLAADRLRPAFLFDSVPTRFVEAAELIDVDPDLDTLANLNHPAEYLSALAKAGFEPAPDVAAMLLAPP